MPGEFDELIPTPRRKPARRFQPTPFEQILAEENEAVFDADDVSFAAQRAVNAGDAQPAGRATIEQLLNPQVEVDASRPPRPSPTFGTPQAIPQRRGEQVRPMLADRFFDAVGRGVNRAFPPDDPIGLNPETVAAFREFGLFNRDPSNPSLLGTTNEVMIGGGTALADLVFRTMAAAAEGGISAIGQSARELGASQGQARRLERDIRAGLVALSLGRLAAPAANTQLRAGMRVRRTKPGMFKPFPVRPMLRQPSTDGDFRREIEHVLETGESSIGRVRNKDLGPITIDFGTPGVGPRFRKGFGLVHIAAKRTAVDGIDGDRFVRERLPQILARGKVQKFREFPDDEFSRRAVIDLGGDRVVLSLFRGKKKKKKTSSQKPKRETWVLTSFEKNGK